MKGQETLFSSDRHDWETPQDFFDRLDAEFDFDLDAAANEHNAKCKRYFAPEDNAIKQDWRGTVWLNPPYGREIGDWIKKAYHEAQQGATVVVLMPARTDTRYWHNYVMQAAEIRLVKGRLKFVGAESSAPFPSAVVVFRPQKLCPPTPALSAMEATT